MGWFEAVVLGIVQGLTEFLPISSSAHLRVVGSIFGWDDPGAAFTAITQIGTETAVVIYFRKDIWRIIKAWFGALPVGPWKNTVPRTDPDARMGWFVILGSIPIGLLGLLYETDRYEEMLRVAEAARTADPRSIRKCPGREAGARITPRERSGYSR